MKMLQENVQKAEQSMEFVCDDLRDGLKNANAVQAIVLLKLVEDANKLRIKIKDLSDAIDLDFPVY